MTRAAFHISEFLADEMQARGWKTVDVARRVNSGRGFATDLLEFEILCCVPQDIDIALTEEYATALGRAFGVSAEYFLNLHSMWKTAPPANREAFDFPDDLLSGDST